MDGIKHRILILLTLLGLLLPAGLWAGFSITVDDSPGGNFIFTPAELTSIENAISPMLSMYTGELAPGMNRAVTMSTLVGYPLGDPLLSGGLFDNFYIGFSMNAALANTQGLSTRNPDPTAIPGGLAHPTLYFGFSLGKKLDLHVKLMWYDDIIMVPPLDLGIVKLTAIDIYQAGVMVRWNIVGRKKIFPGILEFAGFTLNFSINGAYGNLGVSGVLPMPPVSLSLPGAVTADATFNPSYTVDLSWLQFYGAVEAIGYLDVFWIFDLYLGIGLAGGSGYTNSRVTLSGTMSSTDPAWAGGAANNAPEIVDIAVVSTQSFAPAYLVPYLKGGIEINLFVIRLTTEVLVNLWNMHDVGIQLAFRTQW